MAQLNLFELNPPISEEIFDHTAKESCSEGIENQETVTNRIEPIRTIATQLIDGNLDNETPARAEVSQEEPEPTQSTIELPEIGDRVKLKLPKDTESEIYQYLYYYCHHLLTKVGEIKEVTLSPSGNYACIIDFRGEDVYVYPENLTILY